MSAPYPPPPRGVWVLPYRDELGRELLAAITHDGRKVGEMPIVDERLAPEVEMMLWDILDHADPRTTAHLRLL